MRIRCVAMAAATSVLALPAAASATTASVDAGVLHVTAAPGERNDIGFSPQGDAISVRDQMAITPGPGCAAAGSGVTCTGAASATIELGDGDDTFRVLGDSPYVPLTVGGGAGDDMIFTASIEKPAAIVDPGKDTVSCGGGADIVFAGDDSTDDSCEVRVGLGGGEENGDQPFAAYGSSHSDTIGPLPRDWSPAYITPGAGSDTIRTNDFDDVVAGQGNDRVIAFDRASNHIYGGDGNDRVDVRDKTKANRARKDQVHCGAGKDVVYADRNDLVARDCERVKRS
jgi:hypothetical protein